MWSLYYDRFIRGIRLFWKLGGLSEHESAARRRVAANRWGVGWVNKSVNSHVIKMLLAPHQLEAMASVISLLDPVKSNKVLPLNFQWICSRLCPVLFWSDLPWNMMSNNMFWGELARGSSPVRTGQGKGDGYVPLKEEIIKNLCDCHLHRSEGL